MSTCPYDNNISCSAEVRVAETHRVQNSANEKGKIPQFNRGRFAHLCPVNPADCLHYQLCKINQR